MKRFCLILFMAMSAAAQSTNASLSGTVLDPARARVVGVQLSAQNIQTGIVLTGVTNEAGVYQFSFLPSGTYDIEASLPSFKTSVRKGMSVAAAQNLKLDFVLEVTAMAEDVTVTANFAIGTSPYNTFGPNKFDASNSFRIGVFDHTIGENGGIKPKGKLLNLPGT